MANKIPRVPVREQDPKVRATNFEEVCYGYNVEEATLEASRCLNCKNPRCVAACPVNIRIPDFIHHIQRNNHWNLKFHKLHRQIHIPFNIGCIYNIDDSLWVFVQHEISGHDLFTGIR